MRVRTSQDKRIPAPGRAIAAFALVAAIAWILALVVKSDGPPGAAALEDFGNGTHAASDRSGTVLAAARAIEKQPALERAADGLAIMPADPAAARPEGPVHPHPITPAHERIYRENNLVGALNLAVDLQDSPRIRALLSEYRAEFPEDDHVLQDGYAIIADCLERRDEATRARAAHFWRTQIRSQTRRYVRRHCLTP